MFAAALTAVLAIGCSKSTAPAAAPTNAGGTSEPTDGPPAGSKFVCHLDCSGNEAAGYGATEEEARAAAQSYVEDKCNPDDGQYFIVCDPLE